MKKHESLTQSIREVLAMGVFKDIDNLVDSFVYSDDFCWRCVAAACGKGLGILVKDPNYMVRKEVAKRAYGLELLINDPIYDVRIEVAKLGFNLDILMGDDDWHVRLAVAEFGHRPDVLRHDAVSEVRKAAELELLKSDPDKGVLLLQDSEFPEVKLAAVTHITNPENVIGEAYWMNGKIDNSKKVKLESENYLRIETYKFEVYKMLREATYDLKNENTAKRILKKLSMEEC